MFRALTFFHIFLSLDHRLINAWSMLYHRLIIAWSSDCCCHCRAQSRCGSSLPNGPWKEILSAVSQDHHGNGKDGDDDDGEDKDEDGDDNDKDLSPITRGRPRRKSPRSSSLPPSTRSSRSSLIFQSSWSISRSLCLVVACFVLVRAWDEDTLLR